MDSATGRLRVEFWVSLSSGRGRPEKGRMAGRCVEHDAVISDSPDTAGVTECSRT